MAAQVAAERKTAVMRQPVAVAAAAARAMTSAAAAAVAAAVAVGRSPFRFVLLVNPSCSSSQSELLF